MVTPQFNVAAERVLPKVRASSGTRGSSRAQMIGFSAGKRARVMPQTTMRLSHRMDAPASNAVRPASPASGENRRSPMMSGMPQACATRTASGSRSAGIWVRSASARMIAKDSR